MFIYRTLLNVIIMVKLCYNFVIINIIINWSRAVDAWAMLLYIIFLIFYK